MGSTMRKDERSTEPLSVALIGTWELLTRVDRTHAADVVASGPNNSRARGGYDAYFGTYTVDDAHGRVTQRLVGALSSENVGHVLTREMQVMDDVLTLHLETATASGEPVVRTLRWRRVG